MVSVTTYLCVSLTFTKVLSDSSQSAAEVLRIPVRPDRSVITPDSEHDSKSELSSDLVIFSPRKSTVANASLMHVDYLLAQILQFTPATVCNIIYFATLSVYKVISLQLSDVGDLPVLTFGNCVLKAE